jgi:hypothetical protein
MRIGRMKNTDIHPDCVECAVWSMDARAERVRNHHGLGVRSELVLVMVSPNIGSCSDHYRCHFMPPFMILRIYCIWVVCVRNYSVTDVSIMKFFAIVVHTHLVPTWTLGFAKGSAHALYEYSLCFVPCGSYDPKPDSHGRVLAEAFRAVWSVNTAARLPFESSQYRHGRHGAKWLWS